MTKIKLGNVDTMQKCDKEVAMLLAATFGFNCPDNMINEIYCGVYALSEEYFVNLPQWVPGNFPGENYRLENGVVYEAAIDFYIRGMEIKKGNLFSCIYGNTGGGWERFPHRWRVYEA